MAGRHLDITICDGGESGRADSGDHVRPWIGVHFECCNCYTRIYRRPDVAQYAGRCPRCGRTVTVEVGPEGVSARIFRATPG